MVRMEDIMGKEVISTDAIIVGTVEGVNIDPDHWRIPAVRITVTKGLEMALGKKKKTLGSSKAFINTGAVVGFTDTITLAVSMADIKGALVADALWPLNFGNLTGMRVICKKGRQIVDRPGGLRGRTEMVRQHDGLDVDETGRLALVAKQMGYKPSAADVQDFQIALQQEMAKLGY